MSYLVECRNTRGEKFDHFKAKSRFEVCALIVRYRWCEFMTALAYSVRGIELEPCRFSVYKLRD